MPTFSTNFRLIVAPPPLVHLHNFGSRLVKEAGERKFETGNERAEEGWNILHPVSFTFFASLESRRVVDGLRFEKIARQAVYLDAGRGDTYLQFTPPLNILLLSNWLKDLNVN